MMEIDSWFADIFAGENLIWWPYLKKRKSRVRITLLQLIINVWTETDKTDGF